MLDSRNCFNSLSNMWLCAQLCPSLFNNTIQLYYNSTIVLQCIVFALSTSTIQCIVFPLSELSLQLPTVVEAFSRFSSFLFFHVLPWKQFKYSHGQLTEHLSTKMFQPFPTKILNIKIGEQVPRRGSHHPIQDIWFSFFAQEAFLNMLKMPTGQMWFSSIFNQTLKVLTSPMFSSTL